MIKWFNFTTNLMRLLVFTFAFFSMTLGAVIAEEPVVNQPSNLPPGFRWIGAYVMNSKVRVENGVAHPVVISPLSYSVFSDGIDVRVYCTSSGEENYTSYRVYRSDGIGISSSSGEIQVVAGVQAECKQGDMLRQISVTRHSITMVKMPPRSNRVIIVRAKTK